MRIEHIAMYVHDLEAAKAFFVRYFGAIANGGYHNERTGFRSYFLSFDEGARLEIMTRPQMTDAGRAANRAGFAHIAFSLGSAARVDEFTARLHADGYQVVSSPRSTGDGYYESCIVDLEGNQIELTV
ncbi:MAG: VOC family protein [Oscillospiraceae bacterium]|nr:VOC family protein [Oscillospiraceae bacterium]